MPKGTQTTIVRDAIARGTLLFEQREAAIWFKLVTKECTVCGPLNVRQDWTECSPGVMPVIDRVSFMSGDCITAAFLHEHPERASCWYDLLQKRLSPEKVFQFCERTGWSVNSVKSKPLELEEMGMLAAG